MLARQTARVNAGASDRQRYHHQGPHAVAPSGRLGSSVACRHCQQHRVKPPQSTAYTAERACAHVAASTTSLPSQSHHAPPRHIPGTATHRIPAPSSTPRVAQRPPSMQTRAIYPHLRPSCCCCCSHTTTLRLVLWNSQVAAGLRGQALLRARQQCRPRASPAQQ